MAQCQLQPKFWSEYLFLFRHNKPFSVVPFKMYMYGKGRHRIHFYAQNVFMLFLYNRQVDMYEIWCACST